MVHKINRALVVDDSRLARIALAKQLKSRGIEVDMAGTGGESLEYLKTATPDVVFMDFMMPDMDGFEAVRRIFADPDCAKPPVVMYTSQDTPEDRATAKALGIADFLSKPSTDDQLDQVLRRLQSEQPVVVEVTPAAESESAPQPAPAAVAEPVSAERPTAAKTAEIDWEQLRTAARDSAVGAAQDAAERVVRERLAEFRQLLEEALRNTMEQAREAAADSAEAAARVTAEETARATAELVATQSALPMVESMDPESIGRTAREIAEQVAREVAAQVAQDAAQQAAAAVAERTAEPIALRVARQAGVEAAQESLEAERAKLREMLDTLVRSAEFKTQVKGIVFEHALPGIQQAVLSAATQAAREAAREVAERANLAQAAAFQDLEAHLRKQLAELNQPSPFEPPQVKAPWLPGLLAGLAAGAVAAIVVALL